MADKSKARDANRDPITKEPGAHPVGVAGGGAAGAAGGAAIGGAVGGPVGALAGGVVGAVAGGLAGKGAAEAVNPTVEDAYWRDEFSRRPYANGEKYERWRPAYQHGWQSYEKYRGKRYEEVEPKLQQEWERGESAKDLSWDRARNATSDAWKHVDRDRQGDAEKNRS